ncbi:MAG: NAD(P)-binding protein, partial [Pseudomonadota bacterium]|nr:NAD(P)-binding protein [Pseudomonadota bacterium]
MAAESSRLAIIGAGIAGMTAARLWQDRGLSVRLFDKGRNIGGRCATRRRDELAFDHGVPAIAATDGDFRWAMRRWMMAATLQRWRGSMQGFPEGLRLFTGTPDMNAIPARLGAGLDIAQRVEVARVERKPDSGWHLHDADGTALGRFDAVLLTCPLAQAQRLLQPGLNAGWVDPDWFDRPVRMRAVWTVMAAFESRVASPHDAMVLDGEPLEFALRNSSKPERMSAQ